MKPIVAIVAQGAMASGLARVLTGHGLTVLTDLGGRSAASVARARDCGMTAVRRDDLLTADIILSVLPPAHALPFATDLAPLLARAARKPLFVDCNAVNPATVRSIAALIEPTGAEFVDVGIIGLPPRPGAPAPRLHASGAPAARLTVLRDFGLDVRVMQGAVGAASALKMSYAGISKGMLFVASAMLLASERAGVSGALAEELAHSEPQLLASLAKRIPDMLPKAYRWVAEMEQIAGFAADDAPAAQLYRAAARFYERVAADVESGAEGIASLRSFARHAEGA